MKNIQQIKSVASLCMQYLVYDMLIISHTWLKGILKKANWKYLVNENSILITEEKLGVAQMISMCAGGIDIILL